MKRHLDPTVFQSSPPALDVEEGRTTVNNKTLLAAVMALVVFGFAAGVWATTQTLKLIRVEDEIADLSVKLDRLEVKVDAISRRGVAIAMP